MILSINGAGKYSKNVMHCQHTLPKLKQGLKLAPEG